MSGIRASRARRLAVVALGFALMATACGDTGTSTKTWRDVDPCSLADERQIAEIDNSSSPEEVVKPRRSGNEDETATCTWEAAASERYLIVTLAPLMPERINAGPHVRDLDIDGRVGRVSNEQSGRCSLLVAFREAELRIQVHPFIGKRPEEMATRSTAICDTQLSLIKSVAERTNLP
jgi:hypothetical protein